MAHRILIADDDAAIRLLLRRLLEEHAGWEVCGEAVDGGDAVEKAAQLKPDILIIDLAMPQMNGLDAARGIAEVSPSTSMLLLTVQELSSELAGHARSLGFQGAVSKYSGAEVITGVETLLRKQSFFQC